MGFVLEEQDERDRADDETWECSDPMVEIAPFPLLSQALVPLMAVGTINTEGIFEAGLSYLIAGVRLTLAQRSAK